MIATRTPLRISFVGGGTDMPAFYEKHGGAVVSMAIDKYIYITINKKFDGKIRLSYSRTENVETADELKHDLASACLKMFSLSGVEITSVADIPGEGSGLGSSSAFVVGLLLAIDRYCQTNNFRSPKLLAEAGYMIEFGCGHPVGKQDHYASAYGGLHLYKFMKDKSVEVVPIYLDKQEIENLTGQMMLFWTGKTRHSSSILYEQSNNLYICKNSSDSAVKMRDLAYELYDSISQGEIYTLGRYLHKNWVLKQSLANGISNTKLDDIYLSARVAGASGGKICGAGGGGFFLFCAEPDLQAGVEKSIGLRRVDFSYEEEGSKVIYE